MTDLISIPEYARLVGRNPSTIARQVDRGRIPHVVDNGRRMIDRAAADAARRQNSNITNGHGGLPDRFIRRQARWKAQSSTGYEPAVQALLSAAYSTFPDLMRRSMKVLGAAEIDQARAVLALEELIGCLACSAHVAGNRAGIFDYREALPIWAAPTWQDDEARAFVEQWGDDGTGGLWTCTEEGLPGGSELLDEMIDATSTAKP
jgi:hypothetical protein